MVAPATVHPATGEALSPVSNNTPAEVAERVAIAHAAQSAWAATPFESRADRVVKLGQVILERRHEVLPILEQELGRGTTESLMTEVVIALNYAKGAVATAKKALVSERVKLSPIDFPGKTAVIEPVPRGVIGIIAPWNYPLMQFFKPLFPALLAGNAVVMKPSEHTPRTGAWLHGLCTEIFPEGLVQLVQGGGEIGAALLDADINAVVFTGSVRTGKIVATRAAEKLIPCSAELGGKDAAIVLADCDLDRTVIGIAHWALHNAGQDCSSIERVYVVDAIADRFVDQLTKAVSALTVAPAAHADVSPLQNAAQLELVTAQVNQAKEAGATVRCGGEPTGQGYAYAPTVLDHCTDAMEVVTDETFGPVIAVVRVPNVEAAIKAANNSRYGLNGSVWTRDLKKGAELARRLEVGVAMVNNHSFVGVVPQVPWTGTKDTGTGIAASVHSYHTYVRRRTIVVDKSSQPDVFWMPSNDDLDALGNAVAELGLGKLTKVFTLLPLLGKRTKAILKLARGER